SSSPDSRRYSAQPVPQELGGDGDGEDANDAADQDVGELGLHPGSEVAAGDAADAQRDASGPVRRDRAVADGQEGEGEHAAERGHEGRGEGRRGDLGGRAAGSDQDRGQDRSAADPVDTADAPGHGGQADQDEGGDVAGRADRLVRVVVAGGAGGGQPDSERQQQGGDHEVEDTRAGN